MMNELPAVIYSTEIKPDWLDYNGHMNVAYYVLAFDLAVEELLLSIGLGEESAKKTGISTMALESHITYDREVTLGQEVEFRVQLLDHDHKRLHLYLEMHVKGGGGYLASTLEQLSMCVDLKERRSTSFPDGVREKIEALAQEQGRLSRPENMGRKIGIRKKLTEAAGKGLGMGRNGDIVKGVYDAFATGDVLAALAAFDPEIEWREADGSLYADGSPYVGPEAVAEGVFQRTASDVENFAATPKRIIEGGDTVVVEGRYTGTMKATGAPFDAQFAHVWEVRNGRIVRFQQYTDTRQWAEAADS